MNATDNQGWTALHHAAITTIAYWAGTTTGNTGAKFSERAAKCVAVLLAAGARLDAQTETVDTYFRLIPAQILIENGQGAAAAKIMLENDQGSAAEQPHSWKMTPYQLAVALGLQVAPPTPSVLEMRRLLTGGALPDVSTFDDAAAPASGSLRTGTACEACGKGPATGTKLQTCSRCGNARYCSKECQRGHWGAHKAQCREWKVEKDRLTGVREVSLDVMQNLKVK